MEIAKKNTKAIAIAAGVTAAIIGVYVFYKRSMKTRKPRRMSTKEKNALIDKIKITYNGSLLSVDTVIGIFEAISGIAYNDSLAIVSEHIKQRRANRNNFERYAKIIEDYFDQADSITINTEIEVLGRLKINRDIANQSMMNYEAQKDPKLADAKMKTQIGQIAHVENNRELSLEECKTIVIRMIELLETARISLARTKAIVKNPKNVALIINNSVNDIIYEEYGVEDEQIGFALSKFQIPMTEPQLMMRYAKAAKDIGLS